MYGVFNTSKSIGFVCHVPYRWMAHSIATTLTLASQTRLSNAKWLSPTFYDYWEVKRGDWP